MNSGEQHQLPPCPFTADVLACHLDGDLDTWSGGALDHAQDCPQCRLALLRGRRLDAALAEAAGRTAAILDRNPSLAADWLARAEARVPDAATVPSRRGTHYVTLLLAAAVAALVVLVTSPGSTAPAMLPVAMPEPAIVVQPDQPALQVASLPETRAAPLAEREPIQLSSTVRSPAQPAVTTGDSLLTRVPRDRTSVLRLASLLSDNAVEAASVQRGVELLLEASSQPADTAVLRWLGCSSATAVLDQVLADLRRRSLVSSRLCCRLTESLAANQRGPDSLALVCAAARLGDRCTDDVLRRAARRDPGLPEVIAAALRTPFQRPGRSRLLLDLWGDASSRGQLFDDEVTGALLFTGQPAGSARELIEELSDSGNAARRQRCLLAIGMLGDASVRLHLERLLHGPARPEAVAAAWALGRLQPEELKDLNRPACHWLLRAALVVAGAPGTEFWLTGLTADERAFATRARPGLADFARIAELMRLRAVPPP